MINLIHIEKVDSSNVDVVCYDENNTLVVLFLNGGLYKYMNVPLDVYIKLANAESVGKCLNKEIKKTYECEKIFDDDPLYDDIMRQINIDNALYEWANGAYGDVSFMEFLVSINYDDEKWCRKRETIRHMIEGENG